MWGSYVGAGLMIFLQYFTLSSTQIHTKIGQIVCSIVPFCSKGMVTQRLILDNFFTTQTLNDYFILAMIIIFSLAAILGFFIGWGIHSLIRRFR